MEKLATEAREHSSAVAQSLIQEQRSKDGEATTPDAASAPSAAALAEIAAAKAKHKVLMSHVAKSKNVLKG